MKKLLLLFFLATFSFQSHGQDPDIFQNWFLYETYGETMDNFIVRNIDPAIQPSFLLDQTLAFSGVGACNTFSGTLTYDPVENLYLVVSFDATTIDCGHSVHTNFEMEYFGFFIPGSEFYDFIEVGGSGEQLLDLATPFFTGLRLGNVELSVMENLIPTVEIFPNPVLETLFISSEETLQSITIYNIAGQMVLSETEIQNQMDVSKLAPALYFAEFTTSKGKSIQKFIKK